MEKKIISSHAGEGKSKSYRVNSPSHIIIVIYRKYRFQGMYTREILISGVAFGEKLLPDIGNYGVEMLRYQEL